MTNLIIILSVLLNIALIIALAVYMKRFNNAKKECEEKTNEYSDLKYHYNNLTYENQSLRNKQQFYSEKTNELIKKCDRQNAEIESLQSINSTLLNDNRNLSDEISELKKPIEKIVPDELINQTNLASQILKGLDVYSEKYPKDAIEFFTKLIESINGTIKELKKQKHKKVSQK